jgi:membrane protease YdiL (CAAX protease family)
MLLSAAEPLGVPFIAGVWGAIFKAGLPVVAFLACALPIYFIFRKTWRELDAEATDHRNAARLAGTFDPRPVTMFAIVAIVLTLQEYYGGYAFFRDYLKPWLVAQEKAGGWFGELVDLRFYGELYQYGWWALSRIGGYTVLPLVVWKIIFRRDSLLDMGLRTKGIYQHRWIYAACLAVVVPVVVIVASSPDFSNYYPFYKQCSRSWMDLLIWEALYIGQFFALEIFFRGFMLVPLRRTLGSGAVFAMCVPYVMIHYGKPYLEASVAFLAGVALGSLSMKTRSIYAGFALHCTVALLMDGLAIWGAAGFPEVFWPR